MNQEMISSLSNVTASISAMTLLFGLQEEHLSPKPEKPSTEVTLTT